MAIHPRTQYITDKRGRRTAVVIPIRDFEAMVRELEDLRDAQYVDDAEANAEGYVELAELRRSFVDADR